VNALSQRFERVEQPTTLTTPAPTRAVAMAEGPAWQAFLILHWAFVVMLLTVGADKFFDVLAPWGNYLAPVVSDVLGVSAQGFMRTVGVIEILLGLMVAFAPRIGGWLVAGWLWAITVNLLFTAAYTDLALHDAALSLGALALARLSTIYQDAVEPPRRKT
jgi:hypothetical protein